VFLRFLVPNNVSLGDVDPFFVLVVEAHKVLPNAQLLALSDFLHLTVCEAPTLLHQHGDVATDVVGHAAIEVVGQHRDSSSEHRGSGTEGCRCAAAVKRSS
jgi:hypothetical protein